MKSKFIAFSLVCISFFQVDSFAIERINTNEAPFFVGKNVIACGVLKQVKKFKKGLYLNMDDRYPNQSITLILWDDDFDAFYKRFGDIRNYTGKVICGKGIITEYKGRSQMSLINAYSLKIGYDLE